jgi:polar amino acid transport system permease protein
MNLIHEAVVEWLPTLAGALRQTLTLALCAFVLSLAGGALLTIARASRFGPLRRFAIGYVALFRGVPLLALLFFLYFGLTSIGLVMESFSAAVVGLSVVNAAYVAEIFRGAINSIPKGQFEAGRAVGLRSHTLAISVIVPQMISFAVPALLNQSIILIKETSVASLIAAPELMLRARELANDTFEPLEVYIFVGAMYIAIVVPMSALCRFLERRHA